jgi:hypothetical protein
MIRTLGPRPYNGKDLTPSLARAMKKKRQHIIPKCYQKSWCDPATPPNQTPYIWMLSKDGQQKKRKAPEKAFVSADVYTIRLSNAERDLVVEDTLAKIEGTFVNLLEHRRASQT